MRQVLEQKGARQQRRGRALYAYWLTGGVALLLTASAVTTVWMTHRGARSAGLAPDVVPDVVTDERAVPPPPPQRLVYKYSVVAGGVADSAEVMQAIRKDPVVAAHYRGFQAARARNVALGEARQAYVSYRVGNKISWTRKKVTLQKGERVLTDGVAMIRARCGNRISEEAMGGPGLLESPEAETAKPVLPEGGLSLFGQPLRSLAPSERATIPVALESSRLLDQLTIAPNDVSFPGGATQMNGGGGLSPLFFAGDPGVGLARVSTSASPEAGSGRATAMAGGTTTGGSIGTTPGSLGVWTAVPGGGAGSWSGAGGGGAFKPAGAGTAPGPDGLFASGMEGSASDGSGEGTTGGGGGGNAPDGAGGGTTPGEGGEGDIPAGGAGIEILHFSAGGEEAYTPEVPEPSDLVLIGSGLLAVALLSLKRPVRGRFDGEN